MGKHGSQKAPKRQRVYIAMDPVTQDIFPGWFTSAVEAKKVHGAWVVAKVFEWEGKYRVGGA